MIKSGQAEIRSVSFNRADPPGAPVDITSNIEIFDRVGREFFVRPDRPSFTVLMLVQAGSGSHMIDFQQIRLAPGRMVRVKPMQVQSWDLESSVEVTVVMSPIVNPQVAWAPADEPARDLGSESLMTAEALIKALRVEQERFGGDEASERLMLHLFEALEALFDRAGSGPDVHQLPEAYVAFRSRLEKDLAASHHVRDHAAALGYADRTISRACLEVTGRTAKQVLMDCLVLEAKRLLIHTDLSTVAIGAQLGFAEATNFNRFFKRETGEQPGAFRARSQA